MAENNLGLCPFREGELGPHLTQCRVGRRPSVPSGILIHAALWSQLDVGRKLEASAPFWGGGLGPHLTQSRLG